MSDKMDGEGHNRVQVCITATDNGFVHIGLSYISVYSVIFGVYTIPND